MAVTWKKVFTSADTIPLANGGTNSSNTTQGVAIHTGSAYQGLAMSSAQILVGSGGNPTAQSVGGDVTMDANGDFTIGSQKVINGMLADNAVDLDEMAHGTAGDILVSGAGGAPLRLGIGSNGHVLTVDDSDPGGAGTKLKFAAAPTAANSTINDGSGDTDKLPVVFASQIGTANLRGDAADFTFEADVAFSNASGNDLSTPGTGSVISTRGFVGNLAGIASGGDKVKISTDAAASDCSILLAPNGTGDDKFATPQADPDLKWNGTTLTVNGNIDVTGNFTQTTVNSSTLEIEDASVLIAGGSTSSSALQSAHVSGVGLFVHNSDNAEANLARFVYKGMSDANSVYGWRIAKETQNDATAPAPSYGVGVMHVVNSSTTAAGLATDIGIGAMLFSSNATGGLFIQVDE